MYKDRLLTIDEIKTREVKILKAFDRFANKHSLRYWLFFGTLLGAARHEGFIPWDDDIDIVMPKNDYYRFIDLTNSGHLLGDHFRFNSPSVNGGVSSQPFGKIYDMNTRVMHDSLVPIKGLDEGVWIDVFSMVGVDENTSSENSYYLKQFSLRYAFLRRAAQKFTVGESFIGTIRRLLAHIPARLGGVRRWGLQCEKIQNKLPDMFEKEFCLQASYPNEVYPTDLFLDENGHPAYLTFEGNRFPVPVQWDKALEITYGSWQELPPKNERVSNHSFSAYLR